MKKIILSTVAAAALCVPALAQQTQSPPSAQPQSQATSQQGQSGARQTLAGNQMSGSQVRGIQQALDNKGFKSGRVDGKWGPETEAALKEFQKAQNMPGTGEIDSVTIVALGLNGSDFGMRASTTGQAPAGGQNTNAPQQTS